MDNEPLLDLIIVGGGISGLTLAWRAQQAGLSFRLLEAGARTGGLIGSEPHPEALLELGPDSLLVSRPAVRELIDELGLREELLSPLPARPWLANRGRLSPIPAGFRFIAPGQWLPFLATPLLSWSGKLRVLGDLFLPPSPRPDQTLAELVSRRLGREVLERLAQPLVGGIYASDPEKLSLAAVMPHLLQMEKEHGSLIRGLCKSGAAAPAIASLPGGLGQLVAALERRVAGQVICSSPVTALHPTREGWSVRTGDGGWRSRQVVLATPAPQSAALVGSFDQSLCGMMRMIPCRSVAVLNQIYRSEQVKSPPQGCQGFLLPLREGSRFSAVSLTHQKWPGRVRQGYLNLRIHLGGAGREEFLAGPDETVIAEVHSELDRWLGRRGQPLLSRLDRAPCSMPEYRPGHLERIEKIENRSRAWPGLSLTGNWLRGVGVAECISRANLVASRLVAASRDAPEKRLLAGTAP